MRFLFTLFIAVSGLFFSCNSKDGEKTKFDKRVLEVVKSTQGKPITKDQIKTLVKVFHESKNEAERKELARLTILAMQSLKLPVAVQSFRRKALQDPQAKKYFSFLDKEFPNICKLCKTKGYLPCKYCSGSGKCPNVRCKGGTVSYKSITTGNLDSRKKKGEKGKSAKKGEKGRSVKKGKKGGTIVTKSCAFCKGAKKCVRCSGRGTTVSKCPECRVMGRFNVVKKSTLLYQKEVKSILK